MSIEFDKGFWVIQENRLMVDEGKRVMMCHATLESIFHATSVEFTPQDDVSCHINIHMSCHIRSCHAIPEVVDGQWSGRPNWGSVFDNHQGN
jgi:hypothetical protein